MVRSCLGWGAGAGVRGSGSRGEGEGWAPLTPPPCRFSVSNDLKYDAERDLRDIEATGIAVHALSKVGAVLGRVGGKVGRWGPLNWVGRQPGRALLSTSYR